MMMPRTIAVVTVGRSDYGGLVPVLRAIQAEPRLSLRLIAGGAHLDEAQGGTVRAIEADGFSIAERVPMPRASDTPEAVAVSMGQGAAGFARAYARLKPDALLVLGDRYETHAAVAAAVPFRLPVAHVHGGELTAGAFDDALRHAITKLSHLHFAATEEAAGRIARMGEEPWRITVSGAPGLDHLRSLRLLSAEELERQWDLPLTPSPLLVTYHPETLSEQPVEAQIEELVSALRRCDRPVILTQPNADPGGRLIHERIRRFAAEQPNTRLVENLHTQAYFSLMALAGAMVGNSSSGVIEAPSFELPVVNIGARQAGRQRAANVIDVAAQREEIVSAIRRALDPAFTASLRGLASPYGDGRAGERIARVLAETPLDARLLVKRFQDMEPVSA